MDGRQPVLVPRQLGAFQMLLHPVIPLVHAQPVSDNEQRRPRGCGLEHVVQVVHANCSVFGMITRKWQRWLPTAWHFLCVVKFEPGGIGSVCDVLLLAIDTCVSQPCLVVNLAQV